MSKLNEHIDELTKAQFDEFALEYYGVTLDRRKSKAVMLEKFEAEIEGKDPIKQLPWEELLVEEPVETEVVEEASETDSESDGDEGEVSDQGEQEAPEVEVELGFAPMALPYTYGDTKFVPVHWEVCELVGKIQRGELALEDVPASSEYIVKSLFWYIEADGKVTVRETRNSQFITFTKG